MRKIDAQAASLLGQRLGAAGPALPFARAVVEQVAYPLGSSEAAGPGYGAEVAARVLDLLGACEAAATPDSAAVRTLAADPALLAALFQNVDLLYEHGYAHADAVSLLVMAALGEAGERG